LFSGAVAEDHVDLARPVQPEPDLRGKQVPEREDFLVGVLQRRDDTDPDRPSLRQQQAECLLERSAALFVG
jgi:hypothetical protein